MIERDVWEWLLLFGGILTAWTVVLGGALRMFLIPWVQQQVGDVYATCKDVDALGRKVNRQSEDLDVLSERTRSTDHRLDRHADAVNELRNFTEKQLAKPIGALTESIQAMREEQAVIREKTEAQALDIAEIRRFMRE